MKRLLAAGLATALATHALPAAAQTCGATQPDAMDILRAVPVKPNIELLLDTSCSMGSIDPTMPSACSYYAATYNGGDTNLYKIDGLKAVLTGCTSAGDGLLDTWSSKANFAVYHFGGSIGLVSAFGTSGSAQQTAILGLSPSGSTPMSQGIANGAKYFGTTFTDANNPSCRPNFILMLSDGEPNGNNYTYNFNCPVAGDPVQSLSVNAYSPWDGANYIHSHTDLLCSVTGNQTITTYTIGLGAAGSFDPTTLSKIAASGGGQYYYASDISQLGVAFNAIINKMASRRTDFDSAAAIQREGLFADNILYRASFRPTDTGPWNGTVKKQCILPRAATSGKYDTTDQRCILKSNDGSALLTNPSVQDMWTGSTTTSASVGGAGAVILSSLGPAGGTPNTPYYPRNIVTWRAGTASYVQVKPSTWSNDDSWTNGAENAQLINLLHGYTYGAASNGNPLAVNGWPLGDSINGPTLLLRYGQSCEVANTCWVVALMNDGMLHFFDAANGTETTALIPAEVWAQNGICSSQMRQIESQPDCTSTHRYYVDGGAVFFHNDTSGDGIIDPTETAYLVFGLGRGGSVYYEIPMSSFNGVLSATKNPVRPLPWTAGTAFGELRQAWATPWVGQATLAGVKRNVAAFGSGHIPAFDLPASPTPSPVPAGTAAVNGSGTLRTCSTAIGASNCADYSNTGYSDPAPQNLTYGPFTIANVGGYELRFSQFDVDPNDQLVLQDSTGRVVATYSGSGPSGGISARIYESSFSLRFVTDGHATSNKGWTISQIRTLDLITVASAPHYPTIYMLDLDQWNGSTPTGFTGSAANGGILVRISKACQGGTIGTCLDATQFSDLAEMTCPISGEISAYAPNGQLSALYWGDECGQIWKAQISGTSWSVRRLIALNNTIGNLKDQNSSAGQSKDFRKLFRRLDLVLSTCSGRRSIGIYFGTGDIQRPTSQDELTNAALNNGRDVIGVVWDVPDLPANATTANLSDATNTAVDGKTIYNAGKYGWYISLNPYERMLRDPLVIEGVAYFKAYTAPTPSSQECANNHGQDAVYAVNNCTAAAANDLNNDGVFSVSERKSWTGQTDIGGNLLFVTEPAGSPIVTHANVSRSENALLAPLRPKVPRIYNWREPKVN